MKKILLMSILSMVTLACFCPVNHAFFIIKKPVLKPLKALWQASKYVESLNNDRAYNPLENACGCVQIRPIRLKDYNQRTHKSYKLKDCFDPNISKEIWNYYASNFQHTDFERIAKGWNGRGKSNRIYWNKVKKRLKSE